MIKQSAAGDRLILGKADKLFFLIKKRFDSIVREPEPLLAQRHIAVAYTDKGNIGYIKKGTEGSSNAPGGACAFECSLYPLRDI